MELRSFVSKSLALVLAQAILFVAAESCRHDPVYHEPDPDLISDSNCISGKVYFENDILPILISNCAYSGCHDPVTKQEGLILNSYENLFKGGEKLVRPNNPGGSKLYRVITEDDDDERMPPGGSLTDEQIQLIRDWIDQGAPNNRCEEVCDTAVFTYSGAVKKIMDINCRGCHNADYAEKNINVDDLSVLQSLASDGRLKGVTHWEVGYKPMPNGGSKLSECELSQIRKWIENGAQDD